MEKSEYFSCENAENQRNRLDDNIRMIDHHEFFLRAAGNIVSVMNPNTAVFHIHNPFDNYYNSFRSDFRDDFYYIKDKMLATRKSLRQDKS